MTDSAEETVAVEQESGDWIGPGTWLVDHSAGGRIGVVDHVDERDRGMAARIGIRWRHHGYENTSVLLALERFKSARWEVDHAE